MLRIMTSVSAKRVVFGLHTFDGDYTDLESVSSVDVPLSGSSEHILCQRDSLVQSQRLPLHTRLVLVANLVGREEEGERGEGRVGNCDIHTL